MYVEICDLCIRNVECVWYKVGIFSFRFNWLWIGYFDELCRVELL